MRRKTVPIVAGSKKILGLSIAEWNMQMIPFLAYMAFIPGGKIKLICLGVQIFVMIVYVQLAKRIETDFITIWLKNRRIPNIVFGIFDNPVPLKNIAPTKFKLIHADKPKSPGSAAS